MVKPYKYKGILGTHAGSIAWEFGNERDMLSERLDALFRDFGMVPEHRCIPFFRLLLKLAERHVEGFNRSDARGPGHPRKAIDLDLILEFEKRIKPHGKMTQEAAAPHVVKALGRPILNAKGKKKDFAKLYRDQVKKLRPWEREAIDGMLRRELKTDRRRRK